LTARRVVLKEGMDHDDGSGGAVDKELVISIDSVLDSPEKPDNSAAETSGTFLKGRTM